MNIRALVLCDDAWHPAEVVRRGVGALGEAGFSFEFVTRVVGAVQTREQAPHRRADASSARSGELETRGRGVRAPMSGDEPLAGATVPATMLDEFSLVVVAKANQRCAADRRPWLTPETQSVCREFVRRGGGLLIVHGGACYKDLPEMRGVAGGAFLRHPEQCAVTIEPQADGPLSAGVSPFTVFDEHYEMALDAPDAEVFLRSRSEHGVQPAGWTRSEGAGRVWVLTPGHNLAVWLQPGFQALLRHGLNWCAKRN